VTAHQLPDGRELRVVRLHGLVVLGVHGPDGVSGSLAIRETDLTAFAAAVTKETGAELEVDQERVRSVLREQPGIAGYKRLRGALTGISMARRRAAVQALRDGGEIVDQGEPGRPRLHHVAPEPGYSHRNPPSTVEVGAGASEASKAPHAASGAEVEQAPGGAAP
jgi:hypothetical protein